MRVLTCLVLCFHLMSVVESVALLASLCSEDEVSSAADGCAGDEPGCENPCSDNCGGCVRCPVASDLPVPAIVLTPYELPQYRASSLQSLLLSSLQARNIFRPPRVVESFSV